MHILRVTVMGSLCSKSGAHSGGHTVIGSSGNVANPGGPNPSNPRAAAAEAAERRLKAVSFFFLQPPHDLYNHIFRNKQGAHLHQIQIKESLLHK